MLCHIFSLRIVSSITGGASCHSFHSAASDIALGCSSSHVVVPPEAHRSFFESDLVIRFTSDAFTASASTPDNVGAYTKAMKFSLLMRHIAPGLQNTPKLHHPKLPACIRIVISIALLPPGSRIAPKCFIAGKIVLVLAISAASILALPRCGHHNITSCCSAFCAYAAAPSESSRSRLSSSCSCAADCIVGKGNIRMRSSTKAPHPPSPFAPMGSSSKNKFPRELLVTLQDPLLDDVVEVVIYFTQMVVLCM